MGNRLQRRSPTIRDVAREAGVSVATISRVLNRRDDVAAGTRERVLRVIREQGYTRNSTASALSRGRSGLVGVTLPEIKSSYFARLADAIVDALYEHDLRAVFCPTRHERELELSLLDRLMHGTTEAAVLILPSESSTELLAVQDQGYPLVVLDPKTPVGPGIPSVSASNTAGAATATRHLLGLGHRRIAAITGPAGWCATDDRLAGVHAALAEAGIEPEAALEAEADFEVAGGPRRPGCSRFPTVRRPSSPSTTTSRSAPRRLRARSGSSSPATSRSSASTTPSRPRSSRLR